MGLRQIFINPAGRLRSGWRLLVFALVYVAVLFLLTTAARIVYVLAIQFIPSSGIRDYTEHIVFRFLLLAAALIGGLICTRWLEGLPWRALGLSFHMRWLRDFLIGSIIGIASLAVAAGIATAGGGLTFTFAGRSVVFRVVQTLVASAVLFIIAALAEEALFRGYPLQTLTRARLVGLGVFITSLAFAAIHMGNPNLEQGLPYLNLLLAGIWLATAFLRTRSLWFPLGVHWAWNWALGSLCCCCYQS